MIKKFKIWNKEQKTLNGPFSFGDIRAYDGECQVIFFANSSGDFCDIGNNLGYSQDHTKEMQQNLEFLQFTGLLDKNNREIYEGDIVCGEFYDTEYRHSRTVVHPVVFNSGAFNISSTLWFKHSLKILGNIHQNPELLS